MTVWKQFNQIGTVICNYNNGDKQEKKKAKGNHLLLYVGEMVYIKAQSEHWYYGYSLFADQKYFGLFPQNVVALHNYDSVSGCFTFEQEVILTLHEWNKILKEVFISGNSEKCSCIRELMNDIMGKYQLIKLGKLVTKELFELKLEIIEKIDIGNKHLDLDMVIYNNEGMVINPFEVNIIEYFRLHWDKMQKLKSIFRQSNDSNTLKTESSSLKHLSCIAYNDYSNNNNNYNNCYNFCVTISNFICVIKQDMIIYMSIYDANINKFITENYIVKWDKTGFVREIEKINNIRVVFTDFSANDLLQTNKKLYLVCQVIRVGTMHVDNEKARKLGLSTIKTNLDELKRPCGISVYDLNEIMTNPSNHGEINDLYIPLVYYTEKDSLESLLRKILKDQKDSKDICKTQGFIISIRIFESFKMKLLDKYRLYYAQYPSYIARKIGFRDIILPEDVRNDLYLTLVSGEFHKGSKKSEHNIEVTVKVIDENGNIMENCLSVDSHNAMDSFYKSVVYYHEDKPKWFETLKIILPIEKYSNAHLKFTFKHRSSNENKDKNEKPFAISFIRLMNKDETTLKNNDYRLFVYKIDPKKYNENDKSYLTLPSIRNDSNNKSDSENSNSTDLKQIFNKQKLSNIYTYSPRDIFTISIKICSTKLAQNIKILSLLKWRDRKDSLGEILENVQSLEGSEIMKFLHDVLDALFEIWMDPNVSSSYDRDVFDALVSIITHLLQAKYIHFQEILNDYIEKHFSATLVYMKLIESFQYYIQNPESNFSYQTVASMEFIFKFIIRSINLYSILNTDKLDFECALENLFDLFVKLMETKTSDNVIKVQLGILKYFPKIIKNILTVFDEKKLTLVVIGLFNSVTEPSVQKLVCFHEIIESDLFGNYPECRRKLLPGINDHLRILLYTIIEESLTPANEKLNIVALDKCLAIISTAMQILIKQESRIIKQDIADFVIILLKPMIELFHFLQTKPNESSYKFELWSIIIALLNQMTEYHFNEYFKMLNNVGELEILLKAFDCAADFIFPNDWAEMIMTQNIVILLTMNQVINYVKKKINFCEYDLELWHQLFLTAIKFITQKSLSLEKVSIRKRNHIENFHHDMRVEMVVLVRSLWFNLANYKSRFIPSLIGPLLEVAVIPVLEIRKDIIVIFFDMFLCSEKATIFRNEMLTKLDSLITSGKGDEKFQKLLSNIFLQSSETYNEEVKELFEKFVAEVSEQIEKLLIYRDVVQDEDNYEVLMSSIIELLDFYDRIDRRELYISYLYKLYDLHIKYGNFNEAAYTLTKHSILLEWSDKQLEQLLKSEKYTLYNSHRELKEKLYFEIIENFNKGELWEAGIIYCKELIQQYENEIFDYAKLSKLFEKMSTFYRLIITNVRIEPEYFYVTYYGKGFPIFFRNKSFIYRGKSYERLFEFTKRLQNQFPNAKLLDKLDVEESELTNSDTEYLSIFRVDPKVDDEVKNKFLKSTLVDERIIKYYQYNELMEYNFSRKLIKNNNNNDDNGPVLNEFAYMWIERSEYRTAFPLPSLLCRSEIVSRNTYQLDPLKNAIDTMEKVNDKTRAIIFRYLGDRENSNPIHSLLMHIKGIVSSDVQGGISKYEEAFFTTSQNNNYEQEDYDKLKDLIADQIPLLDLAIKIANEKQRQTNQAMDGLYQHIVESFQKMRDDVEHKYGKRELPADMKKIIENHYKMQQLIACETTKIIVSPDPPNSSDGTMTLTKRSKFSKSNTSVNTLTSTLRFRKKERRSACDSLSPSYSSNTSSNQSQWYTADNNKKQSINNLTCIMAPESPLNTSETKSARSSRPNSGSYNNNRASIQSEISLFYQSPSMISLDNNNNDNGSPPPLPVKKLSKLSVSRRKSSGSEKIRINLDQV